MSQVLFQDFKSVFSKEKKNKTHQWVKSNELQYFKYIMSIVPVQCTSPKLH